MSGFAVAVGVSVGSGVAVAVGVAVGGGVAVLVGAGVAVAVMVVAGASAIGAAGAAPEHPTRTNSDSPNARCLNFIGLTSQVRSVYFTILCRFLMPIGRIAAAARRVSDTFLIDVLDFSYAFAL